MIALTKRDKNNLKKSVYELIINTLLILNKERKGSKEPVRPPSAKKQENSSQSKGTFGAM